MPTNVNYEYENAERKFHEAQTDEERLFALEEMIKTMPKHKSAEALRKNIRTRYKKLKSKIKKPKKIKSKTEQAIKKSEMQAVLVGLTNSGKSSILKAITNVNPNIASYGFTTYQPEVGTLNYQGCKIQIIDLPPIASQSFDTGIINTADTILIIIEKIHEIKTILALLKNTAGGKIIIFNKIDLYGENTKRKISETLKSKKYNFAIISTKTDEGIEKLKEKIFKSFNKIRVYTKTPGKQKDNKPMILKPNSTIKDAAEKTLHSYSKNIKQIKIWGPSSKFPGQTVGPEHILKDLDIVEFHTR